MSAWIKYLEAKRSDNKPPIKFRPRFRSHTCDRWGRPITLVPNEYPERATSPTMTEEN